MSKAWLAMGQIQAIVGMSGGVDSSVAAWRLAQQGTSVAGLFMQNWHEQPGDACRASHDRRDAVTVCGLLDIPFFFRDFSQAYWQDVFTVFVQEYARGRTPNPDVLCNREVKFKHFWTAAQALGAERIATGHYARIDRAGQRWRLLRGVDRNKDQSYFLHQLTQDQLAVTEFPIGHLTKPALRQLACDAGIPTHAKKDSTGICFIQPKRFRAFLAHYLPARHGEIYTANGQCLGAHDGVFFYTLGQRQGLNIGGQRGRQPAPWYVIAKDIVCNRLYVDQGHDSPYLLATRVNTETMHWIAGHPPARQFRCTAQVRHRQTDQTCQVTLNDDGTCQVAFEHAQRAVSEGQSLVLYDDQVCLGGAVIASTNSPAQRLINS